MKKILSVFVSVLLLVSSFFSVIAYAEGGSDADLFNNGNCGQTAYWFYVYNTQEFEVTGDGNMQNYDLGSLKKDYEMYTDKIKTVCIDNGITSIGSNAFYSCENLESVQLPDSLTRIERGAFQYCKSLNNISIPPSVNYIGNDAFYGISPLTVYCLEGSYADNYALYPQGTVITYYTDNSVGLKIKDSILSAKHQTCEYIFANYGTPNIDTGIDDFWGRTLNYNNSLFFSCEPMNKTNRIYSVLGTAECIFDNFDKESYDIYGVVNAFDEEGSAQYLTDSGKGDYSLGENQQYVFITNEDYNLEITYNNGEVTKNNIIRITFKSDKAPLSAAIQYVNNKYAKDGFFADDYYAYIFEENRDYYLVFVKSYKLTYIPAVVMQKGTNKVLYDTAVQDYYGGMLEQFLENIDTTKDINEPEISVILDGKRLSFEQPPVIIDGRVLVPLRDIFEAMGAHVQWNSTDRSITAAKGEITIKMLIDSNILSKNDVDISLDVPARLISGYTMIPVRAISEAFGSDVTWDNEEKTVIISSDK